MGVPHFDHASSTFIEYDIEEPSNYEKACVVLHAYIMIIIFFVLLPSGIIPVRYLKFAQDKDDRRWKLKQWFLNHVAFCVPVYPLMFLSLTFVKTVRSSHRWYQLHTDRSFVHGLLGMVCFQLFTSQFFIDILACRFLQIRTSRLLKRMHLCIYYMGYLLGGHVFTTLSLSHRTGTSSIFRRIVYVYMFLQIILHFLFTFYHYLIRLLPFKDEKFFPHVYPHTFLSLLIQNNKEVQRQPFQFMYDYFWKGNMALGIVFSVFLMFQVGSGAEYTTISKSLTPHYSLMGETRYHWPYKNVWTFA